MPENPTVTINYIEDSPVDGVIKIGRLYLKFGFDDCAKDLEEIQHAQLERLFTLISYKPSLEYIIDNKSITVYKL